MIVFLTLVFTALLFLLVQMKILSWTPLTKISPVLFALLLLVFLFIPMQWGAPLANGVVYRNSIQIVPNVTGQVIEVQAVANEPLKAGDVLFKIDPRPFEYALAGKKAALAEAEQAVPQLAASLEAATASVERARAARDRAQQIYERYASANSGAGQPFSEQDVETRRLTFLGNEAALKNAVASEEQARLAATSEIDGVNTAVARLRSEVLQAEYDLEQTTIRAPSDGFATAVALRPGARVAAFPFNSVMAFIDTSETVIGAQVAQIYARHIEAGQMAEVTLKTRPGVVFEARVVSSVKVSAAGQVAPSGFAFEAIPSAPGPMFVRLEIADPAFAADLPAGSTGQVAIYTERMQMTHVIRKVMMRMQAWLNYIVPV